jgi:hypothetical protein
MSTPFHRARRQTDRRGPEGTPETRTFGELLIDCEEDRTLMALLVGMLREADRQSKNRAIGRNHEPAPPRDPAV